MSKLKQNQSLRQSLSPQQVIQANILQLNVSYLEEKILDGLIIIKEMNKLTLRKIQMNMNHRIFMTIIHIIMIFPLENKLTLLKI